MPNTIPPRGGIERMTSHGTVAVIVTGVSEISGAVTLLSCPACGQFSVAVVCTTGSSGVSDGQHEADEPRDRRHPAGDLSYVLVSSWQGPDRSVAAPPEDAHRALFDGGVRALRDDGTTRS